MRRGVTIGALMALLWASPVALIAAQPPQVRPSDTGTITGEARNASGQPLPSAKLRLRDMRTGAVVAEATADKAGAFTFTGIYPGNSYVIELVDTSGRVIGLSPNLTVGAGATLNVVVTATAAGVVGAGAGTGGGLSIFGLGTAASIGVVTAATIATVTTFVVVQKTASASR
jgi:Carboxypeptidase regulatory-like domain